MWMLYMSLKTMKKKIISEKWHFQALQPDPSSLYTFMYSLNVLLLESHGIRANNAVGSSTFRHHSALAKLIWGRVDKMLKH